MDSSNQLHTYNRLFRIAATNGHYVPVTQFIEKFRVEVDSIDEQGNTALIFAAENGHTRIVEYLIEKGANFNKESYYCRTPLKLAAHNGHLDVVKALIAANANVNQMDDKKNFSSPLIDAASNVHVPVVEALIQAGANVNQATSTGHTALMTAVFSNNAVLVSTLLKAGADLSAKNWEGKTAYDLAIENDCLISAKTLIEASVDTADSLLLNAIKERDTFLIKILKEIKLDLNITNHQGRSLFIHAIKTKQWDLVLWLIQMLVNKTHTELKNHPTYYLFSAVTRLMMGVLVAYGLSSGLTALAVSSYLPPILQSISIVPKIISIISMVGGLFASIKLSDAILSRFFGKIKISSAYHKPYDSEKPTIEICMHKNKGLLELFGQNNPYVTPINEIKLQLEQQYCLNNAQSPEAFENSKIFALAYVKKIVESSEYNSAFSQEEKDEVKRLPYISAARKFN